MAHHVPLLIVGAGPFGMGVARVATHAGIEHLTVGIPMEFWSQHMPRGMVLRSDCEWHLDPLDELTVKAYLDTIGKTPDDVEPLELDTFLGYTTWLAREGGFDPVRAYVDRLDTTPGGPGRFAAQLSDGSEVTADHVVLALGFGAFEHVPEDLTRMIPADRLSHTSEKVAFDDLAGRRCVIVGGRQSAFEWAALIAEVGAEQVHVVYRHETPLFTEADWTWVPPLLDRLVEDPAWFRNLPKSEQDAVIGHMWSEGRLKLEPWIAPRLDPQVVRMWPNSVVTACTANEAGTLDISVGEETLTDISHVIAATGYAVDLSKLSLLSTGNVLGDIAVRDGYPVLDEGFQTSVPGLYITSLPAVQDFGPFFGFTISVRASANILGRVLRERIG